MDNHIAAKPGVFMANPMLQQQQQHNHHRSHQLQQPRHSTAGPSSAAQLGGPQASGLHGAGASHTLLQDYFKCPHCSFVTFDSGELEKHFRDVHFPNLPVVRPQQQHAPNGLRPLGNTNSPSRPSPIGRQQKFVGGANFTSSTNQNYCLPSSLADMDESAVAAAKTILSISTSSTKNRRHHQSTTASGTNNRMDSVGTVLNHSAMNNNANFYVDGASYAKSVDHTRQIQQHQQKQHQQLPVQQRTSFVADEGVSNDRVAAAMMDANFRQLFYGANSNTGQHVNHLQANNVANVGLAQQSSVNQLSPAQQQPHAMFNVDNLAALLETQNLLLRNLKVPPVGASGALPPVLNAADLLAYRQQLWLLLAAANANATANAAPSPSQFAALHQLAAAQLLSNNAVVASQIFGGGGGTVVVGPSAAQSPVNAGGVNVGAYLPLRSNDNGAASVIAGRQTIEVCAGRQNVVSATPQISPLMATSSTTVLQASPHGGSGRQAATEDAASSAVHGVVRRHSMLPAINATRVRIETMTSPTVRCSVGSIGQPSLSLRSAAEVEQHITRLITQNEAILEPSPILAKRRTYTRQLNQQAHQQSLSSSTFQHPSSPPLSISPPLPREYRSNSLYSSFSPATSLMTASQRQQQNAAARQSRGLVGAIAPTIVVATASNGKSSSTTTHPFDDNGATTSELTAVAPPIDDTTATLRFLAQVENATLRATEKLLACKFCRLSVRQADDLRRHEEKCARRGVGSVAGVDDLASSGGSTVVAVCGSSKGPLKKRLLAAAELDATIHNTETSKCDSAESLNQLTKTTASKKSPTAAAPPLAAHPQRFAQQQQRQPPPLCLPALQPYTLTVVDKRRSSASPLSSASDACAYVRKPPLTMVTQCFANVARRRMHHALTPSWTATPSALGTIGGNVDHTPAASSSSRRLRGDCFSLYANWPQLPVCPKEALRNLLLMSACTLRVHYSPLRYSQARSSGSDMRVTHSTYWQYAQLSRSLAAHKLHMEQQRGVLRGVAPIVDVATTEPSTHRAPAFDEASHALSIDVEVAATSAVGVVSAGYCQQPATPLLKNPRRCTFRREILAHRRRTRFPLCHELAQESCKQTPRITAADGDSDETISNDGLCVVTDEEDDARNKKTSNNPGLLLDLRRKVEKFGENWKLHMKNDSNGHCVSPFVVDYFEDSADSSLTSPPLPHRRCLSAPPDQLTCDGSAHCDFHGGRRTPLESLEANSKTPCDFSSNDRTFSAFKRPFKSACSKSSVGSDDWNVEEEAEDVDSMHKITPVWTGECSVNVCETCGKKFTNFSLYSLHLDGHFIERPSKRYDCKCSHCTTICRSRTSLQKHMATAHPQISSQKRGLQDVDQSDFTEPSSPGGTLSSPRNKSLQSPALSCKKSQISPEPDPRPFKCLYCEDTLGRKYAFRIHGHLAKHLRSKSHIMKMESMNKVPLGTFSRLEASNDKDKILQQIDISDCDHSLRSLLKIVDEMNLNEKGAVKVADHQSGKGPHASSNPPSITSNIPAASPVKSYSSEKPHCAQQSGERSSSLPSTALCLTPNSATVPPNSVAVPPNYEAVPSNSSYAASTPSISNFLPLLVTSAGGVTVSSHLDASSHFRCVTSSSFVDDVLYAKHATVESAHFMALSSKSTANAATFATVPSNSATLPYSSAVSSLICTETFRPISPACDKKSTVTSSANFCSKKVAADLWVPPKEIPQTAAADSPTFRLQTPSGMASSDFQSTGHVISRHNATGNGSVDHQKDNESTDAVFLCKFCPSSVFSSARDLDVHYHADHVLMRDGSFFKCPKANCGTLYPTRQNLRDHLTSHFHGTTSGSSPVDGNGHGLPVHGCGSSTSTEAGVFHGSRADPLNNRQTVASALSRKLAVLIGDVYDSTPTKKSYCRRMSSARSQCDCSKCSKSSEKVSRHGRSSVPDAVGSNSPPFGVIQQPWTPLSDSDASRLSINSVGGNDDSAISSTTPPPSHAGTPFGVGCFLQTSPQGNSSTFMQDGHTDEIPLVISQWSSTSSCPDRHANGAALTPIGRPSSISLRLSSVKRQATAAADGDSTDAYVKRGRFSDPLLNGDASSAFVDDDIDVDVEEEDDNEVPAEHRRTTNHQQTSESPSFSALNNLRCIACDGQFYTVLELQRHIVAVHSAAAAPSRLSERTFLCAFCDAAFTSERALKAHAPCRPQVLATASQKGQRRRGRAGNVTDETVKANLSK